jgi:GT2 family glycosyltransferase
VIVADNGSTDSSREVAQRWQERSERFRLVDASQHTGPAAARNIGVKTATGDHIAFCDSDDVVRPGWIQAMHKALSQTDVVAGSFEFGSLNGRRELPPQLAVTRQLGQIPAGLAANLGVRRSLFDAVDGFDESLRVGEDVDLCWRIQFAGGSFGVAPDAVVSKRERGTPTEMFRQGLAHGASGPRLFAKHRASGIRRDYYAVFRSWGWLVLTAPLLYTADFRRRWLRVAGVRLGRISGSLHQRVFFP